MKKRILAISLVVILALSLSIVPFTLAGASDYGAELSLDNKTTEWALTPDDGIGGLLEYNPSGTSFEFSLTAEGLSNGDYSLIYYTDTEDRFNDWGGADGIVLATFAVTDGTIDSGDMSVFLGTSLPNDSDANAYFYDYTLSPDYYDNGTGAKIWLVPTSALTAGDMPVTAWPPTDSWLFETDLINFEQLMSNTVGFDGDVENPMLVLGVTGLPDKWYSTATYAVTVTADNPTLVTIEGVYGKLVGWNPEQFDIVYEDMNLATNENCGFWADGVYYFGPAVTSGDTYGPEESKSFDFEITPKKAGAFDIGIVLVAGIADPRTP